MKVNTRTIAFRPSSVLSSRCPSALHCHFRNNAQSTPFRQTRFLSDLLTPTQALTASRILPYRAPPIYKLIADIASYPSFIPYCTASTITTQSNPDPETKQRWPRTADLRIGYGPFDELFRSNVYCLPYTVVEAVAGDAESTIPAEKLPHYHKSPQPSSPSNLSQTQSPEGSALFTSLLTRWTLREFPFKPNPPDGPPQEGSANRHSAQPRTEVSLLIEVQFASAVYSALSQATAPKVAGLIVEAFEKRAHEILGEGLGAEGAHGETLGGVVEGGGVRV